MPSFSSIDTFREGQWRSFRHFVLDERRDAGSREAVILAEQRRIGKIRLLYKTDSETGEVTQERYGFAVEGGPNTSIAKLLKAYIVLGGNPLDLSLFLYPNDAQCPGDGFAYPKGFSYNLQSQEEDSDSNIEKYKPSRVGGTRETLSEIVAVNMDLLRRWTIQEMYQKRILLEERILKLADLYEQLEKEREDLIRATVGAGMKGEYTEERYQNSHTVPVLVYLLDSTFRVPESDGRVLTTAEPNLDVLGSFPMLMSDVSPIEDNNAL
jgi:hypothetical protein